MTVTLETKNSVKSGDDAEDKGILSQTMRKSGYLYLIGDAAIGTAGIMEGAYKKAGVGAIYSVGGLVNAKYGNPTAEKQLEQIAMRLGNYLREQNITIPNKPDIKALTKEGGIIDNVESFIYQHPSQIFNTVAILGGSQLVWDGLRKTGNWDAASGAINILGGLVGLAVPQKNPDPEHPPNTWAGKIYEKIQKQPLAVSGAAFLTNNLTLGMGAIQKYRDGKANGFTKTADYAYIPQALTALSWIVANSLFALSSKNLSDETSNGKEAISKLEDLCAQIIVAQPIESQKAIVEQISSFVSAQPEIKQPTTEIAKAIHERLGKASAKLPAMGKHAQQVTSSLQAAGHSL